MSAVRSGVRRRVWTDHGQSGGREIDQAAWWPAVNLSGGAVVLASDGRRTCVRWKNSYEGLDALVAERGSALLGTAVLLAGSRVAGEDLLQAALERLVRHWSRVRGDKEGY